MASDLLASILADKRLEINAARKARPLATMEAAARQQAPARSLLAALDVDGPARIIAECKRQSPSRGVMVENYDPVKLATAYERGGAAAISVLTDAKYFGGELAHLVAVRAKVKVPVLRKDFILDEYQVFEARAAGADSFLLLSGPLGPEHLEDLLQLGRSLGMEPLIESHTETELAAALKTSGRIFGVNNRDLKTFNVDLGIAKDLAAKADGREPPAILVCESGIRGRADVEAMLGAGYGAFLVGEALATNPLPEAATRALVGPAKS
jgi:indole-3-glycerol phosphate synthase